MKRRGRDDDPYADPHSARALPERPDLDQLRIQARELQRGIRTGDPDALARSDSSGTDARSPVHQFPLHQFPLHQFPLHQFPLHQFPLHRAQLLLAREYGFPSWPRLTRQVAAIAARSWHRNAPRADEPLGQRLLRLACLDYGPDDADVRQRSAAAACLLVEHPELPVGDVAVAAVCGRPDLVRDALRLDPGAAFRPTGPYGWTPLFYLGYGRLPTARAASLDAAGILLAAGADPNDGRFFSGLPTPFTVLTGVFGGGELGQPPHPHAIELARLLLEAGADPNDAQTLYNRQFGADDDFLELLLSYGLGRDQSGPWAALLPDALESPPQLLRGLLDWAVGHGHSERVARLVAAGVDVGSPLTSQSTRLSGFGTPIEAALLGGHVELADRPRAAGASEPDFTPAEAAVAAVMAHDESAVRDLAEGPLRAARREHPGLAVWAASQAGMEAVALAVRLGFDVNAQARADVFCEQPWQTALHTAVERNHAQLVRLLLDLGADPAVRDGRFDATPADWAERLDHRALLPLLSKPPEEAGHDDDRDGDNNGDEFSAADGR